MNKTEIIDIELPVMAGLAKLALFGEVQKMFNLYPGQLAEFFIETAKKEHSDPVNAAKILSEELMPIAQEVFRDRLDKAQALLSIGKVASANLTEVPLTKYFNLDEHRVAKMIRDRIEQAGMDPMEIVDRRWTQGEMVVISLRNAVRKIIPWAFNEAVRIVEQREVASAIAAWS